MQIDGATKLEVHEQALNKRVHVARGSLRATSQKLIGRDPGSYQIFHANKASLLPLGKLGVLA